MSTSPFDAERPPEPEGGRRRRGGPGSPGGADGSRPRRRGDKHAVVPDAQVERYDSYYGRNIVHTPPWENGIPLYIWLGGMAGGSALIGAGAHLAGHQLLRRNARAASLVTVGVGSLALISDLGRPERFLNMMRTVKLTSPMSVGSWILVGFAASTGGAFALEVARPLLERGVRGVRLLDLGLDSLPETAQRALPRRPALFTDERRWHRWLNDGVITPEGRVARVLTALNPLASAASAFFAPPLSAYTAVLLTDTASPTWHEGYREMPFLFVASGTAAGAGLNMILTPTRETRTLRAVAAAAVTCDLAADAALDRRLGDQLGEPLRTGKGGRFHRAAKVLNVIGGVGAVVAGGNRVGAAVAGAALIAGSFCTRFAVFHAGMDSSEDPAYTVDPQRERVDSYREAGASITQPGGDWPG